MEVLLNDKPADTYTFNVVALADGYRDSSPSVTAAGTVATSFSTTALDGITASSSEETLIVNGTFEADRCYGLNLYEDGSRIGVMNTFAESTSVLAFNGPAVSSADAITVQTYTIGGSGNSHTVTYTPEQSTPIPVTVADPAPQVSNIRFEASVENDNRLYLAWDEPSVMENVSGYQIWFSGNSGESWTNGGNRTVDESGGIYPMAQIIGDLPASQNGVYQVRIITIGKNGFANSAPATTANTLTLSHTPAKNMTSATVSDNSMTIIGEFVAGKEYVLTGYSNDGKQSSQATVMAKNSTTITWSVLNGVTLTVRLMDTSYNEGSATVALSAEQSTAIPIATN